MGSYEDLILDIERTMKEIGRGEIMDRKEKAYNLFRMTFGKDVIDGLDQEKAEYFFKEMNKLLGTRVRYKVAFQAFDQFKKGITYLLYGSDPIDVRINNTLHFDQHGKYPYKIIGMQRAPTILLHMSDPEKYCIWNDKTQTILFNRGLLYPINDSWRMYNANNDFHKKIRENVEIDNFSIDFIIRNMEE